MENKLDQEAVAKLHDREKSGQGTLRSRKELTDPSLDAFAQLQQFPL
jgi:hypothetical protein